MKLYELTDNYRQLLELSEDETENSEALDTTLEMLQDSIEDKVENVVKAIRILESQKQMFKNEATIMNNKAKVVDNRINSLKEYINNSLEVAKMENVEAGLFKVRRQKNNPSVEVTSESLLPTEFLIKETSIKADKKAILKALKEGKEFEGATYAPEKYHIRIQ